ncbi:hypothetical protein LCGC14_1695450, partial [marine sediment metagenome]
MPIAPDSLFFDPRAEGTLQAQLQQMVAERILSGHYRTGEKMPSSRRLAQHLGISRMTVTLAYTELMADDYLTSRGRSGYYVSQDAPRPPNFAPRRSAGRVDWGRVLVAAPPRPGPEKPEDWRRYRYPFIYGQTDPALFDHANWRLCALRALGRQDFEAMTADAYAADDPQLVEFIARHILPRRGILAGSDEILITLGAQNALWLTAQVLLGTGRVAGIEDPGYPALRDILARSGCSVLPVPLDDEGVDPERIDPSVEVMFTTPSHQCPTTATMPIERRRALLDLASRRNMLIVEDDYEVELAPARPNPALKSLDDEGRVLYVGSFSKTLFPGLRLGYLVGSAPFIAAARALRSSVIRHPPGHVQRTTAHFLSLGHYDAMMRRMARVLLERRRVMGAAIAAQGLGLAGDGGG